MKTQFTSTQYKVSEEQLYNIIDGSIDNVENIDLWDISILPSGHGHYSIKSVFTVNGNDIVIKTKTSNMALVDAWKEGMSDTYDIREDGHYDNWEEVVDSMLFAIDPADEIFEAVFE